MESMAAGPSHPINPSRLLRKREVIKNHVCRHRMHQPKRWTSWIAAPSVPRDRKRKKKLHDYELTGACGCRRRWSSKVRSCAVHPRYPSTPALVFLQQSCVDMCGGIHQTASSGPADWSPMLPEPVRHARTGHLRNGRAWGPRRWTRALLYRGTDAILSAASAGDSSKLVVLTVLIPPTWSDRVARERRRPLRYWAMAGESATRTRPVKDLWCVVLDVYLAHLLSALPALQLQLSRSDSWPAASWLDSRWCAGGAAVGCLIDLPLDRLRTRQTVG